MTGIMIVHSLSREHAFGADDLIVNAIERVVRERLTSGGTMFISAAATTETGRDHMTVVLTPNTFVQFTYSDLGTDPDTNPRLTSTTDMLRRHVEEHGGICLDDNDMPVEPN